MPKRSKEYPKPTFSFGDDGISTVQCWADNSTID